MDLQAWQKLAPPGVSATIAFEAFTSQWLFYHIEPGPLAHADAYFFDVLVACTLVCYWRTCFTDPGRIPQDWHTNAKQSPEMTGALSNRWCRRCESLKPPRAHHCKTCNRCVMKMDHHCVWSANCVSHITIPHFIRFLIYIVASGTYLEYLLCIRIVPLWEKRNLPSYLGPTPLQLAHLFILVVINTLVLFMTILLLGRTLWSLASNTWTIESWEIERHHALLRRARVLGGYLDGPDGKRVRIEHQEFPWDVGIWTNICQGMGTRNPLLWLWPFASTPMTETGLSFPHNEIDDPSKPWPPPDPDRLYRFQRQPGCGDGFSQPLGLDDFRRRQAADMARYADGDGEYVVRRKPFHERLEDAQKRNDSPFVDDDDDDSTLGGEDANGKADNEGEEAWRSSEGERLADFGVDEEAEFYDEDEVPLGELMRRRGMTGRRRSGS